MKAKGKELRITRIYDAPVELVYRAYTDPEAQLKWWGPRGFTITHHSKDLRPGGQWIYTMHSEDGQDFPNIATYHEVIPNKRLVYDHGATPTTPPLFRVEVDFISLSKKRTEMRMKMIVDSEEKAREMAKFIKQASGNSTWDRLGEFLAENEGDDKFFINRVFETTPEKMLKLWTDANELKNWLPPVGFEMDILKGEIKEGGECFYRMTDRAEFTVYGKNLYKEITPNSKIVYEMRFADEKGNLGQHPLAPDYPPVFLMTIRFTEEDPGEVRVTVEAEATGEATEKQKKFFKDSRGNMTMGWTGSFEKLENYLC